MLTIGRKRKPIDILRDVLLLVHEEVPLAWLKRRTPAERAIFRINPAGNCMAAE